jgi:outer membrane biosynthesis protein TonB
MVANEWLAEQHAEDSRRFLHLLGGSCVAHLLFVAVLAFTPSSDPPPLPKVLRVNLVAGLPAPRAARPTPKAAPAPVPTPKPLPKQVVLPKQAPKAVPKRRVAPPPPRPEPIEYEDALSQLRSELGETAPPVVGPSEDVSDADLEATTAPAEARGSSIDKDTARWVIATKRHVRNRWITPPEFLNRGLVTVVEVLLTSGGEVVGTPRVVRPSGDPYYDDNAVRAMMASTPLPPPPRAGTWKFSFSEDR